MRPVRSAAAESDAGDSGGPARLGGPSGRDPHLPEPRLGQKVSILYRLTGDEEYELSEVVGIVQRLTVDPSRGPLLAVVRRTGELVEIPRADIIRMKIVPTRGSRG